MKKTTRFALLSAVLIGGLLTSYAAPLHAAASGSPAFSQPVGKTVKVIVKDNLGELPGASVLIKGTSKGATANLEGVATLENVPSNAVLTISFVGCITQDVAVDGKDSITVVLEPDTQQLDETVVIGYGVAKRKDYTGSVSSVKLENSPIALASNTNALESIKGNVSGLDIGATNSAGGTPSMQLRGQKSISGSNNPLLVVDGVIFMGSINDIAADDIASIDVLKDATSAAAYGSRSANGVIIITTKKGHSLKPMINFSASTTAQSWANKPTLKSGQSYIDMICATNQTTDMSWMKAQEKENYDNGISTDWLDYSTRTGVKQDYQVSVSGSGNKINYYLSTSYSDNKGIVKGDDYNRISILGKVNTDITSWLNIGLDAAYTKQDYSGVAASLSQAYLMNPYSQPTRKGSDELERFPATQGLNNPLWGTLDSNIDNTDIRNNYRMNLNATVKCPWIEGLSYKFNYSINHTDRNDGTFYYENYYVKEGAYDDDTRYSAAAYQNLLSKANGSVTNYDTQTWVMDNILNYSQTFGKHSIDATAVATRDFYDYNYITSSGSNFAANGNTTLGINGLSKATVQKVSQDGSKKTNIGYMGRVMYSFDDRYFLTGSYRRDGASVFGVNQKWGDFWAVGGAWKVSNEAFYPESWKNVLSVLKLKLSYGVNGNQGLSPYGTLSTVLSGSSGGVRYEFDGSTVQYGLQASALGNADLGWESTAAWNYGFESQWLDGRISADFDGYVSKTTDQIFTRNIPVMTGFKTMKSSLGQVNNYGVEMTIRSVNIRNNDWNWTSGITFWLNRNKLAHLYGEDLDGDGKEDDDVANSYFIGKSLGVIYGYEQDGICQTTDTDYINTYNGKAGYPKYVDQNNDGKINSDDRVILGYSTPNFRLNFSNTVSYKNLELYFLLTGTFGGNGYYLKSNPWAYMVNGTGYATGNCYDIPYWTESNPSNVYPSAAFTSDSKFLGLQSRGFLRMQDISLSYTFKTAWMENAGINNLKAYVSCKNLFTITNWDGGDPELGNTVNSGTQPVARSFTLGVKIGF